MAHQSQLISLTSGLVACITGSSSLKAKTNKALKTLKEHNFARVNQFAVKSKLEGLAEKFVVLDRDDLANALDTRVSKLKQHDSDKFLPDKLALLLALSDRPHERVTSSDLRDLNVEDEPSVSEPTWEDILRDDPLESDIWDNVEPDYHSSGGEDEQSASDVESAVSTSATSAAEGVEQLAREHLINVEPPRLANWTAEQASQLSALTEFDLYRESLLMLRGLPCDLFASTVPGQLRRSPSITLASTTASSLLVVLDRLAEIGSQLIFLREWAHSVQMQAYARSFQTELQSLLLAYDRDLSVIENEVVKGKESMVISLLQLLHDTQPRTRPLILIANIVRASKRHEASHQPFCLLDRLLEATRLARMAGDAAAFALLAELSFTAIETYLRPVASWCASGRLVPHETDFFIVEQSPDCDKTDIWSLRFRIRNDLQPPAFMSSHIESIFASGKQQMFTSLLARDQSRTDQPALPSLDFGRLITGLQRDTLADFDHALNTAISSWLANLAHSPDPSPMAILRVDYGLLQVLNAYEYLFLARDSALFDDLTSLFSRYLRNDSTVSSSTSYTLTELARAAMCTSRHIDIERLSIQLRPVPTKSLNTSLVTTFQRISINYSVPWPLVSILQESTPTTYVRIWILLAQAQRAKDVLQGGSRNIAAVKSYTAGSKSILRLRFHLLSFIDVVASHITSTCRNIHRDMLGRMEAAHTVDGAIALWREHCQTLAEAALLTPAAAQVHHALVQIFILGEIVGMEWSASITKLAKGDNDTDSQHLTTFATGGLARYRSSVTSLIDLLRDMERTSTNLDHSATLADRLELCSNDLG